MRAVLGFSTLVAAALAAAALAASVSAAPTDLDPLFGGGGIVLGTSNILDYGVRDTKIDPNRKIVTLSGSGSPADIRVSRYNTDGTPDMSFDGDGVKLVDVAGSQDHGNELYIYDDASILIAANVRIPPSTGSYFALVKLECDGDLDPTFGVGGTDGNGIVSTPVGYDDAGYGLSLDVQDSDGKIVVGGEADGNNTATYDGDFALARYTSNGTIDTTFGFDDGSTVDPNDRLGWVTQSLEPTPNEKAIKVWAQGDGKILAAGQTQVGIDIFFALSRFQSTGFIDPTFAIGGHKTVPAISNYADLPKDAVMQADGKVVIVGETLWDVGLSGRSDKDFAIARLNTDGTMDSTFAGDGTLATDFDLAHDFANAVTTDECGRLLVAGQTGDGTNPTVSAADEFALLRVTPTGGLDSTFGTGGRFTQTFGTIEDRATSIAFQSVDNMFVVGGASYNSTPLTGDKPVVERFAGGGACVDPVPEAPAAPAAPAAPPAAKIAAPRHNRTHRARRLLKVSGTATGDNFTEVQLALRRETRGRCVWIKSGSGSERRSKRRASCPKTAWLKANGTSSWNYSFKRKLPHGRYRLYVRLKLADGSYADDFVSGESAVHFTIR